MIEGRQKDDDSLIVISGSEKVHNIADSYGIKSYLTVYEMCALYPYLVPLSFHAGYPYNKNDLIE